MDTAVFAGNLSAYRISQAGADHVIVGEDGQDTLRGDVERAQFADAVIAFDGAGAAGEVFRLYEAAFKREGDAAGLGYWIAAMERGTSAVQVAQAFLASAEFQSTYGSNDDARFVAGLYLNALGREGASAEIAFHVDALKTTSRAQLLLNFSESPENRVRNILDADGPAAQLHRLYDAVFDRSPDTSGLLHHERAMTQGVALQSIAQQFVGSPEFQSTYGSVGDARFVELLYANVLGRTPDAGGLAYQLDALRSGTSRAQLVVNFSESPEHRGDAEFVGVIRDWVAFTPG